MTSTARALSPSIFTATSSSQQDELLVAPKRIPMDVQTALSGVALPALRQVVRAGELDSVDVAGVDDPAPGSIVIRVRLVGEVFEDLLVDSRVQPEPTAEEFCDRFLSNLIDFI